MPAGARFGGREALAFGGIERSAPWRSCFQIGVSWEADPHNGVALGVGGRELVALSLGCRSCPMLTNEQDASSFADRRGVGAVIISVMLTISIVASIYICFVPR